MVGRGGTMWHDKAQPIRHIRNGQHDMLEILIQWQTHGPTMGYHITPHGWPLKAKQKSE